MISKLKIVLLLACVLIIPLRQSLAQDTPRLEIEGQNGVLSIAIPEDWQVLRAPEGVDPYGAITNRGRVKNREAPTDVQLIFRKPEALNINLLIPIDTDAPNPAYDYLFKYAQQRSDINYGRYNLPVEIPASPVPTAMMLYVEQADGYRYGERVPAVVALAVAMFLDADEFALILLDGPAESSDILLAMWAEILPTIMLDDEVPEIDLSALLPTFDDPAVLLDSYLAVSPTVMAPAAVATPVLPLPGENLSVSLGGNTLVFSRYAGWEAQLLGGYLATVEHESGAAEIRLSFEVLEDADSPAAALAALAADDDLVLVAEPLAFEWGEVPAAVATFEKDDQQGTLLVAQAQGAFLQIRLLAESEIDAQTRQDWRNMVTVIRLNGVDMDFASLFTALERLPD